MNSKDYREGHWPISNKHEADEKYWFSTEEALKQAREYAKEKSIQYPEKTIVLIDGLQQCNGGFIETDYAEVYDMDGNVVLKYASGFAPVATATGPDKLTEEIMTKIKARQVVVEEEERLEELKREAYWNKKQALSKPIKEAYEKAYQSYMYGLRGSHYKRYNEKGLAILSPRGTENDPEWKAYEAGAKDGFEVAFKYLQQNREELDLINTHFINEEEKT
jgi:hypothetical protein